MVHPDQKYVDALLTNNAAVQQELYNNFFNTIKEMVLNNNGTAGDAADIMQEALLAIYFRARKSPLLITDSFEAFLYTVCKYKWMKELGKRKSKSITIDESKDLNKAAEDYLRLIDEYLLHKERESLIMEKLNEMEESCRKLLQLCWSGKSLHEVAAILKVTYPYVRKRKCGCMGRLVGLIRRSGKYNDLR
jgi:RNA polymerase sigma factor (sigma-70 family)